MPQLIAVAISCDFFENSCEFILKYPKKSAILTAKKTHYKIHYFEASLLKDSIKQEFPEGTGAILIPSQLQGWKVFRDELKKKSNFRKIFLLFSDKKMIRKPW